MNVSEVVARHDACAKCSTRWGGPVLFEGQPGGICFVAEALGTVEVELRRPLIGPAGQLFNRILKAAGINREECFLMNTASCRPPNNKIDQSFIDNCATVREDLLVAANPRVIVALGATAAKALCPKDFKRGILEARGKVFQRHGIPVVITLHPSYIMRQEEQARTGQLSDRIVNVLKRNVLNDYLLAKETTQGGSSCERGRPKILS